MRSGRGSLCFEYTNHTRREQQPHQHDLSHQYGSAQTKRNKLCISNRQEMNCQEHRQSNTCVHYRVLSLAASSKNECDSNELAKQDCTKCNDNEGKIDLGISQNYEIGNILCLEYQSSTLASGFQQFQHAGCLVEICNLQAFAVDKRLGNGQSQRKDIALTDLNIDNAKVVSANGIERTKQLGSRLDGDKAICGDLARSDRIGNSTAQSFDILNGIERNAAALIQSTGTFQLHRIIFQIRYGNRLHCRHGGVKEVVNSFFSGGTANLSVCCCRQF